MTDYTGLTEKELIKQLGEQEQIKGEILGSIPEIVYLLEESSGKILFCNSELKELFKINYQGSEYSYLQYIIHPDDVAAWERSVESALKNNTITREPEIRIRTKNNNYIRYRFRNQYLVDENKKSFIVGSGRKIPPENSRLSPDLSGILFPSSNAAMMALKPMSDETGTIINFKIIKTNESFLEKTGYSEAEGKSVSELYTEEKAKEFISKLKTVYTSGENMHQIDSEEINGETCYTRTSYLLSGEHVLVSYKDITEQQKREQKINEHAKFIERIAKASPDLILVYDFVLSRHVYINKEIEDILGLGPDDLKQSSASLMEQHLHPDDHSQNQLYKEALRNAEDTEVVQDIYRLKDGGGKWLWFMRRGVVFQRNEKGEVIQYLEVSHNITHQKETESQLKESIREQAKAHMILDTINDACFELDTKCCFIYVNRKTTEILNTPKTALLGKNIWELFPSMKATPCYTAVQKAMTENLPYEEDYLSASCNTWISLSSVPTGKGVILKLTDISDRIAAKNELFEKNELLYNITESTPDLIQVINSNGKIVFSNNNLYDLIGYSKSELNQLNITAIFSRIHSDDHHLLQNLWISLIIQNTDAIFQAEWRCRDKNNKWVWLRSRAKIFKRNPEAKPSEFIFITQNITEQKKAEEKLIESEKFSLKGNLARTIAHEIRNPLTNIHLSSDIIRKLRQDPHTEGKSIESCLDIISRNTGNIDKLIKDLLTPSSENRKMETSDLADIVQESLHAVEDRIYLRGVKVNFIKAENVVILADREGMKVAFLNIIINAIDAMDEGAGQLDITITEETEKARLIIRDNGCGMTKEQVKKVFDPYFTLKQKGLGLGLANVLHILNCHKALVDVESEPGNGTAFIISFKKV